MKQTDFDEFDLQSTGEKCPHSADKNYTLTVHLECRGATKPTPYKLYVDDEECTVEVSMLQPNCEVKCTTLAADAYLLDLRTIPKVIEVKGPNKTFSLSLCGPNERCKEAGVTACEFNGNEVVPLASYESQLVNYDVAKGELSVRGNYKPNGNKRCKCYIIVSL